jgi:hypothetical protein
MQNTWTVKERIVDSNTLWSIGAAIDAVSQVPRCGDGASGRPEDQDCRNSGYSSHFQGKARIEAEAARFLGVFSNGCLDSEMRLSKGRDTALSQDKSRSR